MDCWTVKTWKRAVFSVLSITQCCPNNIKLTITLIFQDTQTKERTGIVLLELEKKNKLKKDA